MTIMTAHAAEPPTNLDKRKGDWILSPGRDTSNADKLITIRLGNAIRKRDRLRGECETAATSDEMVSLMAKGGYDLVRHLAMPRCV